MFADRADAGRQLAERLAHLKDEGPVVLALPRGGIPVGLQIAERLDAPLDLVLVGKIGAPGHEEYGIGAICDGPEPIVMLDRTMVSLLAVPESYIASQQRRLLDEMERRRRCWLGERCRPAVEGRCVIIVDDGIATGWTMRVALRSVQGRRPRQVIVAVPVAPQDTLRALAKETDEVVCLATPRLFSAISGFYADFHQLGDDEVSALLTQAAAFGRRDGTISG